METKVKLLAGHTSPETAYVVDDYPYGFRLRCKIRYWIEYNKKHGFRFCSQTTNPKRAGTHWNTPKKSTYAKFGACMFLDENEHVQWAALSEYSDAEKARKFFDKYKEGMSAEAIEACSEWIRLKTMYENDPDGWHKTYLAEEVSKLKSVEPA